jgi:hypothetical protein
MVTAVFCKDIDVDASVGEGITCRNILRGCEVDPGLSPLSPVMGFLVFGGGAAGQNYEVVQHAPMNGDSPGTTTKEVKRIQGRTPTERRLIALSVDVDVNQLGEHAFDVYVSGAIAARVTFQVFAKTMH